LVAHGGHSYLRQIQAQLLDRALSTGAAVANEGAGLVVPLSKQKIDCVLERAGGSMVVLGRDENVGIENGDLSRPPFGVRLTVLPHYWRHWLIEKRQVGKDHRIAGRPTHRGTTARDQSFSVLHGVAFASQHRAGARMVSRSVANRCSKHSNKITRPIQLLSPVYAQNFIASPLTSRPLKGNAPTVDLVLGYKKSNKSPILKLLLSRLDELVARVSKKFQ
jgi:hypothetical protein